MTKQQIGDFPAGAHFNAFHQPATASEMREAATVLTVCDQLNVSDLVRQAIICAALGESGFEPTRVSSAGAKGVFQLMQSWWSKIDWRDTETQARHFINVGFYKYGSAKHLAAANPSMSPGEIASRVEGSATDGQNAGYYNGFLSEAKKIIGLWRGKSGGKNAKPGSSDTVFTLKEYQFTRGLPGRRESSWDAMQRLASEVNWRCFIAGGVVVYASDDWLIDNPPRETFTFDGSDDWLTDRPGYDWDHGKIAGNVELHVRSVRWAHLPGTNVHFAGSKWGPIQGYWLVLDVDQNLFDVNDCVVTLTKPIKPRKEPAPEVITTAGNARPGVGSGTGSVAYVGDSLGVGTLPYFSKIVTTRIGSNVVGGRSSSSGIDALETILKDHGYDNLVLDLGTNDTQAVELRKSIQRARRLAPQAQIYLLTMTGPDWTPPRVNFHVGEKNRMLNGLSDAHIHVVDWNSFARRHNVSFDATHTHPDAAGYKQRAHLLARAMGFEA